MELTGIYYLNEIGGKTNQEDYIWPEPGKATLHNKVFIVSDGVGGHDSGEIASRIISEYVGNAIGKLENREMSGAIIDGLLMAAKKTMVNYAYQQGLNTDMATTFTLLVLAEKKVFISWCGDSRIYHIRGNKILYKTIDHSLVNSLIKSGEITEDEAQNHPRKNVILRAIRADESEPQADHHLISDIMDGDYFLLCTDGLLENISDSDLIFLLTQNDKGSIDIIKGFEQFCKNKTRDNYSMYLLKVKQSRKASGYKFKIALLSVFLLLLISASLLLINRYLQRKDLHPENNASPVTILSADSSPIKIKDTVLVKVMPSPAAIQINKADDSLTTKSHPKLITVPPMPTTPALKPKDIKKPAIIEIDNSTDTNNEKAPDSGEQKNSSAVEKNTAVPVKDSL